MTQPFGPPPPPAAPQSEIAKFIAGFGYAFAGLWYALRTQRNVRVHVAIAIIVILLAIFLRLSAVEFAILFVAITGVFTAEMFNTVIELCVNLASPEYHPLAKIAKDVAAGAVLLSAMLSIIIGVCVFLPHLWPLLSRFL
ncbi:MAG TPA: diacylglycerol kinase family protein [Ktedonobacteraceae bacterium]|jgi:diacylglycerol kinase|nr:diacylglycerol kinase family protein [Ktedonobacteraceae bacterium]